MGGGGPGTGGYRPPGPASPCLSENPGRDGQVLLETLKAAGVAGVTLETFHQLIEELQRLLLIAVDEDALDENLVLIFEDNLFICHADLLRVFVVRSVGLL